MVFSTRCSRARCARRVTRRPCSCSSRCCANEERSSSGLRASAGCIETTRAAGFPPARECRQLAEKGEVAPSRIAVPRRFPSNRLEQELSFPRAPQSTKRRRESRILVNGLLDTTRTCARRTPRHSETTTLSAVARKRPVVEWRTGKERNEATFLSGSLYRDDRPHTLSTYT